MVVEGLWAPAAGSVYVIHSSLRHRLRLGLIGELCASIQLDEGGAKPEKGDIFGWLIKDAHRDRQ